MKKLPERTRNSPERKAKLEAWYEQITRQIEWDSQFHDFSLSEEWDKDFHKAMMKGLEKAERKKRLRKKALSVAASLVVVVLAGVGVTQKEAVGDCLKTVFRNESEEAGSQHTHFGTKEDLRVIVDGEQTRFDYKGKKLEEIYLQIRDNLKRPIFQITNELGEYKILDAYYEEALELVVINLETSEGKIYISQEERLNDGGTGANHKTQNMIVWNDNLEQDIVVSKSIQDDSYSFFVQNNGVIFNFHGYISYEMCYQIAENLLFQ